MTYTERVNEAKKQVIVVENIYDLQIMNIKEDMTNYPRCDYPTEYTIYYNMLIGVMDLKSAAIEAVYTKYLGDGK